MCSSRFFAVRFPLLIALQKKHSAGPGKNGKSAFGAVLRPFKDAVSTHKTRFMEVGGLSPFVSAENCRSFHSFIHFLSR